jgi:uncharacterized membrane protein YcaP (DUF421 family)
MNKERVSSDEIFTQMHQTGLYKLEQVRWAILETDGRIAIIKTEGTNVTAQNKEDRHTH